MIVVLALSAALAFGASVALQERAAAEVHHDHALKVGLLVRVARRPLWLLGIVASIIGVILQIWALRHGSLVVVQPVMATTLVFALVLVALRTRQALHPAEWVAVGAVVAGLAVFLIMATPDGQGAESPHTTAWWLTGGCTVAIVGALALTAVRRFGRRRAGLLGLAAGLSNAFVAVLTKEFSQSLRHGGPLYAHWSLWALIAAGIPAVLLVQSLYQSGNLNMSLPIVSIIEPVAACIAGVWLFGEHITFDGDETIAICLALVVAVLGLWHLAGNPRITVTGATPRVSAGQSEIGHGSVSKAFRPLARPAEFDRGAR
jgi:drug/metabolite transporter (DMT)-like permease